VQASSAGFYSSRTPYAVDLSVPLWSNLGYWDESRTIIEAQAEMARQLGAAAAFVASDEVLDVGCGCADQDILWCREGDLKRIIGIDITPVRVELANARIASAGLDTRIQIQLGSATDLPFPDASFDKVVSLEAAPHFRSREDFLREAFRVLRPGGRLALTDMLPGANAAPSAVDKVLTRLSRRLLCMPDENMYAAPAYRAILSRQGFTEIEIRSIADYVFPGCMLYRAMLAKGGSSSAPVTVRTEDLVAGDWNSLWRDGCGIDDYVMVTALKPGRDRATRSDRFH
jgi:microcystin synthetase protein McyJ